MFGIAFFASHILPDIFDSPHQTPHEWKNAKKPGFACAEVLVVKVLAFLPGRRMNGRNIRQRGKPCGVWKGLFGGGGEGGGVIPKVIQEKDFFFFFCVSPMIWEPLWILFLDVFAWKSFFQTVKKLS